MKSMSSTSLQSQKQLQELSLQKDRSWLFEVVLLQVVATPCLPVLILGYNDARFITGDNMTQKITPLCSISRQKFFTHCKMVCFLIFRQVMKNPSCRQFSVTQVIRNNWTFPYNIPTSTTISNIVRRRSPSISLRIVRMFVLVMLIRIRYAWLSFSTDSRPHEKFLCQL